MVLLPKLSFERLCIWRSNQDSNKQTLMGGQRQHFSISLAMPHMVRESTSHPLRYKLDHYLQKLQSTPVPRCLTRPLELHRIP